jgi:hypothetical protein
LLPTFPRNDFLRLEKGFGLDLAPFFLKHARHAGDQANTWQDLALLKLASGLVAE